MPPDDIDSEITDTALVDLGADQETVEPTVTAEPADAPTAADEPKTFEEAAAQALADLRGEPAKPADAATDADAEGEDKAEAETDAGEKGASGEDDDRLSDEEMKALPKRAVKRISTLTRKRREAEEALETFRTESAPLREKAESFEKFHQVLDSANLDGNDLAATLPIMAAIKSGDAAKALEMLTPIYQRLQQSAGQAISPEYQQRVDDGHMSEEAALQATKRDAELVRERARLEALEGREAQRSQQTQQQEQAQAYISEASKATADLRRTDPTFDRKAPAIAERVKAQLARFGQPRTPQDMGELVRDAHAFVTNATAAKARTSTPPQPPASGSPNVRATPKTAAEAAKLGLLEARGM